jgi:hypothetical protein
MSGKKKRESFRDKNTQLFKESFKNSDRPFACGNCKNEHLINNPCQFCILPEILKKTSGG